MARVAWLATPFRLHVAALLAAAALHACSDSTPRAPLEAVDPTGPAPAVEASHVFEDSPLTGLLTLSPEASTIGWAYRADIDGDGAFDHEGLLTSRIGFVYRFDRPGVHRLRVELDGPAGTTETVLRVVVNDAAAVRVLATGSIPPPEGGLADGFLAITAAGDGTLYAPYYGGRLYEIDPHALTVRRELTVGNGPLNVAVAPSDSLVFLTGDNDDFMLVHRNRWELLWHERLRNGEYFVRALEDRRVVTSGEYPFMAMVDPVSGTVLHQFHPSLSNLRPWTWHFDVSPGGQELAVVGFGPSSSDEVSLYLLDARDLSLRRTIALPGIRIPEVVAYHPSGDRFYVLGQDRESAGIRFLVLDAAAGQVRVSVLLRRSGCVQCNTAPMAVTRDGRFVVMLTQNDAYFVDTALDLPRYRISVGIGVIATPVDDALYFVTRDGALTKVAVPELAPE